MVLRWVNKLGWQRIFLTDLTDGSLGGELAGLATDFFTGFNGWFLGGELAGLATDFLNGFNGWFFGG